MAEPCLKYNSWNVGTTTRQKQEGKRVENTHTLLLLCATVVRPLSNNTTKQKQNKKDFNKKKERKKKKIKLKTEQKILQNP